MAPLFLSCCSLWLAWAKGPAKTSPKNPPEKKTRYGCTYTSNAQPRSALGCTFTPKDEQTLKNSIAWKVLCLWVVTSRPAVLSWNVFCVWVLFLGHAVASRARGTSLTLPVCACLSVIDDKEAMWWE